MCIRDSSQLEQWENYRSCLPGLERVKQAVTARVLSTDLDGPEARDLVELAVSRAVDLLSGGLKESLTPRSSCRSAGHGFLLLSAVSQSHYIL